MAGAPGFEPGNAGIKIRCLTAWRRPNEVTQVLTKIILTVKQKYSFFMTDFFRRKNALKNQEFATNLQQTPENYTASDFTEQP